MESALKRLRLDAEQPTPLYRQLARQLEAAIEAGLWQAGDALPSERALAERLGISRITARKALDQLVSIGLIQRARGSGTFIAPRLNQSLARLTSFTELLEQRGYRPSSRWLSRTEDWPMAEERWRLGLSDGAPIARLRRLRLADDVVVAVEESCLPVAVVGDPLAVTQSLYAHLEARGRTIVRALQYVSAVNADAELARLAQVAPGQALLKVTRLGFVADGQAAELTVTYCRTDYYDFMVELTQ
ncbi:GntR family transcriptional regulator [Salinicola avicenniae]|uniref:GntR family transcriptional regulator n=1 Tax=Salinicola avicenniae TaxID=2916836 RepID=UPI002073CD1C|nr:MULTISPECIES: GntR family transcriptional regulator [unclassified Salinicola]